MASYLGATPGGGNQFQSLKGFQRFCGSRLPLVMSRFTNSGVSIPKRVSEVLWLTTLPPRFQQFIVSIPKRVSEVLWQYNHITPESILKFQSLKGFQRFCG